MPKANWPKKAPSAYFQRRIERAARTLARACIAADIDLSYVDADGLLVSVTRVGTQARRSKRKRR